jgi:hypothetical protein
MVKVHFTDPGEFCAEIEADKAKIERNIVRATVRWEPSKMLATIQHVAAVAYYSVDGQIVELYKYCGDVWGLSTGRDEEVVALAHKHMGMVQDTCKRLGIEYRAGTLTEEP